jgi:hypothetical protein
MTVGTKAPNIAINLRGKEVITIATEAISQTVFVILDGRAQFYYLHTTYYLFSSRGESLLADSIRWRTE